MWDIGKVRNIRIISQATKGKQVRRMVGVEGEDADKVEMLYNIFTDKLQALREACNDTKTSDHTIHLLQQEVNQRLFYLFF